jgi:OmpA-OmpF porin, OOP family
MKPSTLRAAGLAVPAIFLLASGASARDIPLGQKAKIEGVITSRAGENMTVRTDLGLVIARLTESTDVKAKKGRLGILKEGAAATALIPGLKLDVEGVGDDHGQLIATKVRFASEDLKTARAIQAGLSETEGKVAANREAIGQVQGEQAELTRRFGQLGDYEVRAEATVYFAVGSAAIPQEGATELAQVAAKAREMPGYMIGVEGYADASGSADINQKLSLERSQAVVNWLAQNGGIPFYRMLAPGAMSTASPAASNETESGRAQNRRVVVNVLVNRGIAGQ